MELDLDLLASIASGGLGSWVQYKNGQPIYIRHDDCIPCLKELQRFLREDDEERREAFFAVAKYNFARSDLVPLIVSYPDEHDVIYNALKVCTLLTHQHRLANGTIYRKHEQAVAMAAVRDSFLAQDALAAVVGLVAEPLSRHPKMKERDGALVELIISFIGNLLAIDDGPSQIKQRQVFLDRLLADDVADLMRLLASHARHRPFRNNAARLVELFLNFFRGISPDILLGAEAAVAREKKEEEERNLQLTAVASATSSRKHPLPPSATTAHLARIPPRRGGGATMQQMAVSTLGRKSLVAQAPSRHAHSGAVYVRRHQDHMTPIVVRNNPLLSELPKLSVAAADPKKLGAHKGDGTSFNSKTVQQLSSSASHLLRLHQHMEAFLSEAYSPLMKSIWNQLRSGLLLSGLEKEDFENFIKLATYCLQYVRLREEKKLSEKLMKGHSSLEGEEEEEEESMESPFTSIGATLDWDTFHWVRVLLLQVADVEDGRGAKQTNRADKKWNLQHATVLFLKEMLLTIDLARVAGSSEDKGAADRLQRRLLHDDAKDSGLLPVVSRLIRGYNYRFQPRSTAIDLIETLHAILSVLDRLSESGSFRVRQKARVVRRKKKSTAQKKDEGDGIGSDAGGIDWLVGVPTASHDKDAESQGSEQKEEHDDDDDDDDEPTARFVETAFEGGRRIRQECAQPAVVHFYTWLLQGYKTNSSFSNHAIVSFLRRICSLGLEPMLWQLSILRVFHEILTDPSLSRKEGGNDLISFAKIVTRNLMARLTPDLSEFRAAIGSAEKAEVDGLLTVEEEDGDTRERVELSIEQAKEAKQEAELAIKMKEACASMAFVELLFWKGPNVAESIADEYCWEKIISPPEPVQKRRGGGDSGDDDDDGYDPQLGFASHVAKKKPGTFTDEEAERLKQAFENCNGRKDCLADLVFEFGGAFKKVHVSRQLKAMGLAKGKLTDGQKSRLEELYQEYKTAEDWADVISLELNAGFSKNQICRFAREMGLIAGKTKKTQGGPTKQAQSQSISSSAVTSDREEEDDDESCSDEDAEQNPLQDSLDAPLHETYADEIVDVRKRKQSVHDEEEEPVPSPKRPRSPEPVKPPSGPSLEAKKAALEALKQRRLAITDQHEPVVTAEQSPNEKENDIENAMMEESDEDHPPLLHIQPERLKKRLGKRLLKKSSNTTAEVAPNTLDLFDELADF